MPLPTDSSDWFSFLEEAWSVESLSPEPPGVVVKTDADLWRIWRIAADLDLDLQNFDSWLSGIISQKSQRRTLAETIAGCLGLAGKIRLELEAGAVQRCAKCAGVMTTVKWREATSTAQRNFPDLRFVCVEPIKLLGDEKLKNSFSLQMYLEILGSERVVLDGKLVSRGALESDLLNSPFSKSAKWHDELKVVLATEPEESWAGEIVGVNPEREVVFRQEITRDSVCSTCGRVEDSEEFSADSLARADATELALWYWGDKKLTEILEWTVADLIAEFGLQADFNLEVLGSLGLLQFRAFLHAGDLVRADAFNLWVYMHAEQRGGRDLLAFDVPRAREVAGRALISDLLKTSGSRLFIDDGSHARFFEASSDHKNSFYRCIWGRARGCIARRVGVFDRVVAPFFETSEGRLSGVRAASFSSIGCLRCEDKLCKSCCGSGVQERYWGLKSGGVTLKEFMCLPLSAAAQLPGFGAVREILEKLVALGFGSLSLGSAEMVRTSPAWNGYEIYVADLLAGRVRGGWGEIEEILKPL